MKTILAFFIILMFFNCKKKTPQLNTQNKEKQEVFIERADSINENFLSKAVYDTALFYNNSPKHIGGFLLNEKKLHFGLEELNNFFTEEEKQMPIPIKEVTWKLNSIDFITVWYREIDNVFTPIDTNVFNRTTEY